MTYQELNPDSNTIVDILRYPLTGNYYFYAEILTGLFLIITFILYFEEKNRTGRSNFLSCMAISSIGIAVLAIAGSLLPIITGDILLITLVFCGVFVVIWLLTSDN